MDLELLEAFLLWCSIINITILFLWFFMFVFAKSFIYNLHSKWFKIPQDRFDSIHYSAMAFWKLSLFLFNIVPYIALRIIT